jgi:hypothetical protein
VAITFSVFNRHFLGVVMVKKAKKEQAQEAETANENYEPIQGAEILSEAESKVFDMQLEAESLVSDLRNVIIGYLKELPNVCFDALKENEQHDLSSKLEHFVRVQIKKTLSIVAGGGCDAVVAKVDSITVKGVLKVAVKVEDTSENYDILGKMRSRTEVMLVAVSLSDFDKIQKEAAITPDQPDLLEGDAIDKKPFAIKKLED